MNGIELMFNKRTKRGEFLVRHNDRVMTFDQFGACEEEKDFSFEKANELNNAYVPLKEKKFDCESFIVTKKMNTDAVKFALNEMGFDERREMSTVKISTVFFTIASDINAVGDKYIAIKAKVSRTDLKSLELAFQWLVNEFTKELEPEQN